MEVDTFTDNTYKWTNGSEKDKFNPQMVDSVYDDQLKAKNFEFKKLLSYEISQYLEQYLWPNFDPVTSSNQHLMSIVLMVNTKVRERVEAWGFTDDQLTKFSAFFLRLSKMMIEDQTLSLAERTQLLLFWTNCINSIEVEVIRACLQKYINPMLWTSLSNRRREQEFKKDPSYGKFFRAFLRKDQSMDIKQLEESMFQRTFLVKLVEQFFRILETIPSDEDVKQLDRKGLFKVNFCERFVDFLIDIESILKTREFFDPVLDELHVVIKCRNSNLFRREVEGHLFRQLLERLIVYARFEVDNVSGEPLTDKQMLDMHYSKLFELQKVVFKSYPSKLHQFIVSNIAAIDSRNDLIKNFDLLEIEELQDVCMKIGLMDSETKVNDKKVLLEMITFVHERFKSQLQQLNQVPLYPTEDIIWDENVVPSTYHSGESCLALPKLNLQFLTLHDYLLRNFQLFRLESTYEIRQDIEDAVFRMKPWKSEDGSAMFGGWARMALAIDSCTIIEIKKPNIGEDHPSRVRAEIRVNLNVKREIKREWETLRRHDVCFLVCLEPTLDPGSRFNFKEPFVPQVGLKYVRGCEIEGMLDPHGKLIEEGSNEHHYYDTDFRTYRVFLDPNQFAVDTRSSKMFSTADVYDSVNVIIRRKSKENNFKAVLETIRDIMNTRAVVPGWLIEVLLGYGDPDEATCTSLKSQLADIKSELEEIKEKKLDPDVELDVKKHELIKLFKETDFTEMDFNDTFLDFEHLQSCFPDSSIEFANNVTTQDPPFKLTFCDEEKRVIVTPYQILLRGPYLYEQPRKNAVAFTPTQITAIKSGMQPGLSIIVGPPGTGKTDVAVQIISNIYHNHPDQRTLIVTHSNQALNQLFEKIMALDIDERHLLRMGHGEEALDTDKVMSRYGRVNYVLVERLALLEKVSKLALSLGLSGDAGSTCETAGYFYLYHVYSRWEEFMSKLNENSSVSEVVSYFPFKKFFEDAPQPLFKGQNFEHDLEVARGCFRHIKKIFTKLDEFKAFEMLRTGSDRARYLLVKEAKIIAMTCTHAALKRNDLVSIGFQYDNILMEESGQILEIETFIPLLLQNPEFGHNRLKRWIMIGDHHQLPPVIKNQAFQKYSNMEQSLFCRLIKSGVPTIDLDAQGRARSTLCDLYRWRYKNLGDLPHVQSLPEFTHANTGFVHEYQVINVNDFNGVGESEPVAYFYQNLAEAEFVVATFMYMRLLGYPAEKITVLTTYNGQKHLIRDVIQQRCASNPFIGVPHKVTTVDKYQGQQNDFILLSLVRTRTVGHLRDVRRLVVAMSRARLGLYIFARTSVFNTCHELSRSFKILMARPQQLQLLPEEEYPTSRSVNDRVTPTVTITQMPEMVEFVYNLYLKKVEEWKVKKPEVFQKLTQVAAPKTDAEPEKQMTTTIEVVPEEEMEEEFGFEKLTEDDTGLEDADVDLVEEDKPEKSDDVTLE